MTSSLHPSHTHQSSTLAAQSSTIRISIHTAQIHIHLMPDCSSTSMHDFTNSASGKPTCPHFVPDHECLPAPFWVPVCLVLSSSPSSYDPVSYLTASLFPDLSLSPVRASYFLVLQIQPTLLTKVMTNSTDVLHLETVHPMSL